MRHSALLVALSASFGLSALRCSSDEGTLPGAGGTSSTGATAGSGHALGGAAGNAVGTGGTSAGTVGSGGSSGSGAVSSVGGTQGGGAGGTLGGASGSAGALLGGAGPSGASGMMSMGGAGMGGVGNAGTPGGSSGSGFGFGGRAGNGGMSGTGVTAGMSGSGAGGATVSAFAPVRAILLNSCGTKDCHPNKNSEHANLKDTDGKLLDRLLSTTTTIVKAKDACAKLPLVVPGDPDASLIMAMIVPDESGRENCGKRMPDDCAEPMAPRDCLTDAEIETIRAWIAAGALP